MDAKKDSGPNRKPDLRELDRKVAQQLDELLEDVIKARVEPFIDDKVHDVGTRVISVEGKLSKIDGKIADSECKLRTELTKQTEEKYRTLTDAQERIEKNSETANIELEGNLATVRDQLQSRVDNAVGSIEQTKSELMGTMQSRFDNASNQLRSQRDEILAELQRIERKLFFAIMGVAALILLAVGGVALEVLLAH
jgi:flagellin-like hook-associated protein FlgL